MSRPRWLLWTQTSRCLLWFLETCFFIKTLRRGLGRLRRAPDTVGLGNEEVEEASLCPGASAVMSVLFGKDLDASERLFISQVRLSGCRYPRGSGNCVSRHQTMIAKELARTLILFTSTFTYLLFITVLGVPTGT